MKSIKISGKRNQDKINKVENPQRLDAKKWTFSDDYYTHQKQIQIINMLFLKEDMDHKNFFEKEIIKKNQWI